MSHDEARREEREDEGDAEIKAERKRRYQATQATGELSEFARADLVLSEPGVGAVALAWGAREATPPTLLMRGTGGRAVQIAMGARRTGVPVCLDPILVRALVHLDEGAALPSTLYDAVARAAARARPTAASGARGGGPRQGERIRR
jgi:flagellar biosynthesis protein FlhB